MRTLNLLKDVDSCRKTIYSYISMCYMLSGYIYIYYIVYIVMHERVRPFRVRLATRDWRCCRGWASFSMGVNSR